MFNVREITLNNVSTPLDLTCKIVGLLIHFLYKYNFGIDGCFQFRHSQSITPVNINFELTPQIKLGGSGTASARPIHSCWYFLLDNHQSVPTANL